MTHLLLCFGWSLLQTNWLNWIHSVTLISASHKQAVNYRIPLSTLTHPNQLAFTKVSTLKHYNSYVYIRAVSWFDGGNWFINNDYLKRLVWVQWNQALYVFLGQLYGSSALRGQHRHKKVKLCATLHAWFNIEQFEITCKNTNKFLSE